MTQPMERIPKPDGALKEQTIQQATRLFREQAHVQKPRLSLLESLSGQWKPFAAGALAALLLLFASQQFGKQTVTEADNSEITVLREMHQLFGNQLQAVIQEGSNIEPVVSKSSGFIRAQPIIITLRDGNKEIRVLSFSGNTVSLRINGQTVNLSPIVAADGSIIVESRDFIWSNGQSVGKTPAALSAKALGLSL